MARDPEAPDGGAPASKAPRRPLVQRTALHALKTLVRKHPGAALDAAGSGAAYAAKSVIADGVAAVKSGVEKITDGLTPATSDAHLPDGAEETSSNATPAVEAEPDPPAASPAKLTSEQRQELADTLTDEERDALAALARETSKD
jgi:hypothetical protein